MGVYVKDATAPKNCTGCIAVHYYMSMVGDAGMLCEVTGLSMDDYYSDGRPDWCPLIEVPEPHGRLIDADALHKLFEDQWHHLQVLDWSENPTAEAKQSGINWCINTMHDDAPTVIPASEEDK